MTLLDIVQEAMKIVDAEKAEEFGPTNSEMQILGLYAKGHYFEEICGELDIQSQTLKNYLSSIRKNLEQKRQFT
jgi:DNA-binding NarL/FixJ family response regulator